jgi:hypothetical protein
MVITAVLAASMVIDNSNLYSNSLAIGPPHCDQPGLPSCYRVGYNAGLLGSGPCPSGHSSEFCRGWNDATKGNVTNVVIFVLIAVLVIILVSKLISKLKHRRKDRKDSTFRNLLRKRR